jgi:hypothetical protein
MALLTRTGDQRWETHDGKYYLYGQYTGGNGRVRYSVGKHTPTGDEHIEDVFGLRQARTFLQDLLLKTGDN